MSKRPAALITGGAKRIGARIATHLASCGYDIVLHYRNSKTEAEATAKKLRAKGAKVTLIKADLADTKSLGRFWKQLPACSVFVHNASSFRRDTLATLTAGSLHEHMTVHLEAPLLLAQGFMKQLPKGVTGNIIVLGDGEYGWCVGPAFFSYSVTKHAWESVIDVLAAAAAPRARANLLLLGPTERNSDDDAKTFAKLAAASPLERASQVEDVLGAIDYLLHAPAVTGQAISLANGFGLRSFRQRLPR